MRAENIPLFLLIALLAIGIIAVVWRRPNDVAQCQVPLQQPQPGMAIVDEWHSLDRLVRVTGWESADSNLAVARELRGIRIQLDRLNTNLEKANRGAGNPAVSDH